MRSVGEKQRCCPSHLWTKCLPIHVSGFCQLCPTQAKWKSDGPQRVLKKLAWSLCLRF